MNQASMADKTLARDGHTPAWQNTIAGLLAIAGILLSFFIFVQLRAREQEHVRRAFEQAADERVAALKRTVDLDSLIMKSIESFYAGSNEVDRQEFRVFTAPLLASRPSISALQWVLRVPEIQRARNEAAARDDGCADFTITQYDEKGALAPASRRESYYPIFFCEPLKNSAPALGFDLRTDQQCREAMRQSCSSGRLIATANKAPGREARGPAGLRLFMPVYRKQAPLGTSAERLENLDGFAVGVLSARGVCEEVESTLTTAGIDTWLFDGAAADTRQLLYFHPSRMRASNVAVSELEAAGPPPGLRHRATLDIGQRQWTMLSTPAPAFVAAHTTWQPWAGMAACLLLTGMIVVHLFGAAAHNARTERLALQLAKTNQRCEKELADRQQAEEAVQRESAKLAAMISCMQEGVVFADADNVIVEINDTMCRLVGSPRSAILGRRIADFHAQEVLARVLEQIEQFRRETGCGPLVLQRPLGDKEVLMRMQPIYRDRAYEGVVFNVIDVSELVQARRRAEVANSAKSDFLAKMSHEIRTPMTAILGYADLLMDSALSASDRANYLAVVRRNGEHLLSLLNDILDLSKIEAGKLAIDIGRCGLAALLADVAGTMQPRAEQRGISLSVEYRGALPESIATDGTRLRQALCNLVGNAVKFTERGTVRIAASFLPNWTNSGPAVRIDVIDTGVGIRKGLLEHLFQPFVQGNVSISQQSGGAGLGLAISRHIAELLHGELTVQSTLGEGSTFSLTVPSGDVQGVRMLLCPADATPQASATAEIPRSGELAGMRILLAEDGLDNQALIRVLLRKAGAEVVLVDNGRRAVCAAEAESFDVILMDVNMPDMDGYEATRKLRDGGCDRPILALTANAMSRDSQRSLAAGCNDHLTKPINREQLIRTIARHAGQAPAHSDRSSPSAEALQAQGAEPVRSQFADDPEMASILEGFLSRLDGQVDAMRCALANGCYEELQRLAHKLKGSGGSYGYPSLTDAAKSLEDAAKVCDTETIAPALVRVTALCHVIVDSSHACVSAGGKQP